MRLLGLKEKIYPISATEMRVNPAASQRVVDLSSKTSGLVMHESWCKILPYHFLDTMYLYHSYIANLYPPLSVASAAGSVLASPGAIVDDRAGIGGLSVRWPSLRAS